MSEAEKLPSTDGIDPFLDAYLEPFRGWLAQDDVTELLVNRPGEVWIEQRGKMTCHKAPKVDDALLQRLAEQVARVSHQGISRERPLLAAMLPNGARVQFVAPTATRANWALAIRRRSTRTTKATSARPASRCPSAGWSSTRRVRSPRAAR